jgi:hypothetical protein
MTTIGRGRARGALSLQALLVLLAMIALTVGPTPLAGAQEEPDGEDGVFCDADSFVEEWEEEDGELEEFTFYVTSPGQAVTCEATGLDPDQDVSWNVDFYDLMDGEEFAFGERDEGDEADEGDEGDEELPLHSSQGETRAADEHDGQIEFTFTVPDDIVVFGLFNGHVAQGPEDDPTYHEEFFGLIEMEWHEGDMTCEPEPAPRGGDVDCLVEEMAPDEDFEWGVYFFSLREFLDLIADGDEPDEEFPGEEEELAEDDAEDDGAEDDEFFQPDVSGDGVTDEDGEGSFRFGIPSDREIDVYLAHAGQPDRDAVYVGQVVDEEEPPGGNGGNGSTEGAAGGSGAPTTGAQPVERPARIDAGGGGTADRPLPPGGIAFVLLLAAGGAVTRTRRSSPTTR